MILLFDIGNTNTHVGLADTKRVVRQTDVPTGSWSGGDGCRRVRAFVADAPIHGAALCSVVPQATPLVRDAMHARWHVTAFELTSRNVVGLEVHYPRPETIGPDRLANAVAARQRFGAPVIVLDFGTAVTFDVIDPRGRYIGGVIAPGLSAMTDYLHERTALLPRIRIQDVRRAIGRSTEEAMRIGAVHGYRGLVKELLAELKRELQVRRLPVVATGGYAGLIARRLPEITAIDPALTLEGLRLTWSGSREEPED
jgi:type III pantothenate kinase